MVIEQLAYKPKTFARLCDLRERFIKQEIYGGNLKAIKKGNRWRIPAEAAREYLALKDSQNTSAYRRQRPRLIEIEKSPAYQYSILYRAETRVVDPDLCLFIARQVKPDAERVVAAWDVELERSD